MLVIDLTKVRNKESLLSIWLVVGTQPSCFHNSVAQVDVRMSIVEWRERGEDGIAGLSVRLAASGRDRMGVPRYDTDIIQVRGPSRRFVVKSWNNGGKINGVDRGERFDLGHCDSWSC